MAQRCPLPRRHARFLRSDRGATRTTCYGRRMEEPRRRPGLYRLLAAAVFVALLAGGLLLGRQERRAAEPAATPAGKQAPAPPRAIGAQPPLGRRDLVDAAAVAAEAYASGQPPSLSRLAGRRFMLRLPFGCFGPALEGSSDTSQWRVDPEAGTLRIEVVPKTWTDLPWLGAGEGRPIEAVEGFWIERPWLRGEDCPAAPAARAPMPVVTEPRETIGLAEFHAAGDSRVGRREGRPYQSVLKLAPEQPTPTRGLRLLLEGRVAALPDGTVARCTSPSIDQRPQCLLSVAFERVAFEDPATGQVLQDWTD